MNCNLSNDRHPSLVSEEQEEHQLSIHPQQVWYGFS